MNKTVPGIASVRSETYEQLKAEAEEAGLSLPEYVYREWEKTQPRFTRKEIIERIEARAPLFAGLDAAELVREGREERDAEIDGWLKDVGRR
jgi:hypothetical protein